jgi:ribosomal protein S18 acetylase RimI-like enzyme
MIRELDAQELADTFFDLMGEVECGDHIDFSDPGHVAWLHERISVQFARGTRFYGLFSESGEPLGFVGLLLEYGLNGDCRKAEVLDIGVQKGQRRMGFGAELLAHAEKLSAEAGAYCIFVATYAASYDVIAFYGKNGYVPVATIPDTNGPDDEGDVHMRKVLAAS